MKRLFFAIAILPWLLIACDTVTFEESQPAGSEVLKEFPSHLNGHYFDYDNNVDLFITPSQAHSTYTLDDTIHIKMLKETERLSGDSLYNLSTGNSYVVNRINDTLINGYRYNDTLFNAADPENILKTDGDNYFVNHKVDEHSWAVSKLVLKGRLLNIAHIETENEVRLMEQIVNKAADSTRPLHIKPTKEQFQSFVEQNGFTKGSTYLKTDSLPAI